MSNKRDIMRAMWPVLGLIAGALLCLALSLLMSGCKTRYITQEVPVVVHDSIRVIQNERITDTIRETNTISLIDTMWLDTSTIATLGMPTLHHDRTTNVSSNKQEISSRATSNMVHIEKEKPAVVTKTEVKEVNRLHWWQKALMWLGVVAGLLGGAWVLWRIKA